MVWYAHPFQNFPQFIVIHTVKGFGIVNKAEIYVFLKLSCFLDDPADVGNLISGASALSKTAFSFLYLAVIDTSKGVIDVDSYFSCSFTHTHLQTFLKDSKQYQAGL